MISGYSGADMANLCREAALGPIRSIAFDEIETISAEQVRFRDLNNIAPLTLLSCISIQPFVTKTVLN